MPAVRADRMSCGRASLMRTTWVILEAGKIARQAGCMVRSHALQQPALPAPIPALNCTEEIPCTRREMTPEQGISGGLA